MPVVIGDDPDFDLASLSARVRPDRLAAQYDEEVSILATVSKSQNGGEPTVQTNVYRKYRYSPLQASRNIRLLRLPTVNDIDASLEEYSLDDTPTFFALSYTWGKGEPEYPLLIGDYIVHLRKNLFHALQKIRLRGITLIWIDAICIDQGNIHERASQVTLMREIYQKAKWVIIDLGGTSDSDPGLREFFGNIRKISQVHGAVGGFIDPNQFDWDHLEQYGLPSLDDAKWRSLNIFLESPWFTRVWVTQEFASAKKEVILCDGWTTESDEILHSFGPLYNFGLSAHPAISTKAEMAVHRFAMMTRLNLEIAHQGRLPSLIYLLVQDRQAQVTDPRDRVYGLLGISKEAETAALRPNYAESVRDLYLRVARYFASEPSVPLLLYSAGIRTAEHDLPSWVPCWDNSSWEPVLRMDPTWDHLSNIFKAAGETECLVNLEENELVLRIQGIIFDSVVRVGVVPAAPGSISASGLVSLIWEAADMIRGSSSVYPTGEGIHQVLSRLLFCDMVPGSFMKAPKEVLSHYMDALVLKQELPRAVDNGEESQREIFVRISQWLQEAGLGWDDFAQFKKAAEDSHRGGIITAYKARRCITRKGYICQVPPEVMDGDIIAVFYGCEVPFLLRAAGEDCYKLVGNCYVHGIMYGEAHGFPVQDIRLV